MASGFGALLILGILIFVHELGHFLAAKWRRVGVIEFAIGFGKILFSRRFGETIYTLRLIPLGGFVRMAGDDPNMVFGDPNNPNRAESVLTGAAEGNPEEQEYFKDSNTWFLKKGLWSRSIIIIAGPLFNLIFAWVLAVGMFSVYGKAKELNIPVIGGVFPGYPAEQAGIKEGDKVVSIDNLPISTWVELAETIRDSSGRELKLTIERNSAGVVESKSISLKGTQESSDLDLLNKVEDKTKKPLNFFKVGIVPELGRQSVGVPEAVLLGTEQVVSLCTLTFRIFKALIDGVVAPSKVLGGPIAVISGAAKSAKRGFESSIEFMILLSVSLCIFNLLPVPILDGGHLMFIILESLIRRPLNLKFVAVANNIGMVLLLSLMFFALSNDLMRLF